MRVLFFRLLVSFAATAGGFDCGAAEERLADRGAIGRAWSGHPVGFDLLVEHGQVFVAYYDADRRLTVAARAPGESTWTTVRLPGVRNEAKGRMTNVLGWDSHNALVLVMDRKGLLHLSGNMHVDPLIYYRTRRPRDITSFERVDRMTGENEDRCTYPRFLKNQAGELLFSYRDGSSGNASDLFNRYDEATRTWSRHISTPLHDGEGRRSAYTLAPTLGPDGRFHILWMWRDTPDAATNQRLGYARSRDLRNWEGSRGRPVRLPITFGQGELVDPATPGEGLVNTSYTLGFDRGQRPVALYHRYDAEGRSQIFAARPAGDHWERRALTAWDFRWAFGGNGSLAAEVYLKTPRTDAEGRLLVPVTAPGGRGGVLRFDPLAIGPAELLPAEPPLLPAEFMRPTSAYPGMEVRTRSAVETGIRYVLRWETLPTNRDHPRETIPPATELKLFETRETPLGFPTNAP